MGTALVLSGGGDKGAFSVGAVEVLLNHGYRFDIISGTSTGALIAPLVAIDEIEEAVRIYTTVRKKDIVRFNWFGFWKAWYHTRPLKKLITKVMAGRRFEKLSLATPIIICSVSFQTGMPVYFSQREEFDGVNRWENFDEFVAAVLASTNQPLIMPYSMLRGEQCWDGGVREIAPTNILESVGGIDRVIVVVNSPEEVAQTDDQFSCFATIGPRALDVMTTEILQNDISEGLDLPPDAVTVIRPSTALPTTGLEFVPDVMREMVDIGRREAKALLGCNEN